VKVLLFGAKGQLGHELVAPLSCFGELQAVDLDDTDVTDDRALEARIDAARPEVIVNACAYTDVDGAEAQPELAMAVNCEAVAAMGRLCCDRRIGLVHVSTDFVFDGRASTPYDEEAATAPLNVYGQSKLAGEQRLLELDAPAVILRTAWLYGLRSKSFVSAILRLARQRTSLRIVDDQYGNPTFCRDLAVAVALLIHRVREAPFDQLSQARGVYHAVSSGVASRYELAQATLELDPRRDQQRLEQLEAIPTSAYPTPAQRPLYTALDCSKLWRRLGLRLPPWRDSLARALSPRPALTP